MNYEEAKPYFGLTHPVGSIITLKDGTRLKVVPARFCIGCFFETLCNSCDYFATSEVGECSATFRSDEKNVKFIKVKSQSHKVTK